MVSYVTTRDDAVDPNDGATSLREAIILANADPTSADTIIFDPGVFDLDAAPVSRTIRLVDASDPDGTTDLDVVGPLTIDGDLNGDGAPDVIVDGNGTDRVFDVADGGDGAAQPVTLNGLTITGGASPEAFGENAGGGMRVAEGTKVVISNSDLSGNDGGGLNFYGFGASTGTDVTITSSTVRGNAGTGVVVAGYGKATLDDSVLRSNGGDGLIADRSSAVTINNSTLADNGGNGLSATRFSTVNLNGSTVSGNGGDGVFAFRSGDVTLTNSTVSGNLGSGAYTLFDGAVTLNSSTVSGNREGGVDASTSSGASLRNSVVVGNAGFDVYGFYGAGVEAHNSVLGDVCDVRGNVAGAAFRVDVDNAFGIDPQDVFAALDSAIGGRLADNGGPTETIALLDDPTNPAFNAADDGPATDQRGVIRPQGGGFDVGSFELIGLVDQLRLGQEAPGSVDIVAAEDGLVVDAVDASGDIGNVLLLPNVNASITALEEGAAASVPHLTLTLAKGLGVAGTGGGDDRVEANEAVRLHLGAREATAATINLFDVVDVSGDNASLRVQAYDDGVLVEDRVLTRAILDTQASGTLEAAPIIYRTRGGAAFDELRIGDGEPTQDLSFAFRDAVFELVTPPEPPAA